jgi:hypothetical protein
LLEEVPPKTRAGIEVWNLGILPAIVVELED